MPSPPVSVHELVPCDATHQACRRRPLGLRVSLEVKPVLEQNLVVSRKVFRIVVPHAVAAQFDQPFYALAPPVSGTF